MGCRRNARAYFTFFTVTVSVLLIVVFMNLADFACVTDELRKVAAGLGLLVAVSGIIGIPLLVQNCYARRMALAASAKPVVAAPAAVSTSSPQPRRRRTRRARFESEASVSDV